MADDRTDDDDDDPGRSPHDHVRRLFPQVYADLKRLAARYLNEENGYQTLQPTALVHESYMRLARVHRIDWQGRTHVFAMAAVQMRRILVEHARARLRHKRGGAASRVPLDETMVVCGNQSLNLLALDMALKHLELRSKRQCRVAEMRLFSEMTVPAIAGVLGISERTVKSDWAIARAWLSVRLKRRGSDPAP